jgi:demethylmenaquinone methyltransferase/2-methoxy-6-polyprenyl-1,4-benzoquinol methylase
MNENVNTIFSSIASRYDMMNMLLTFNIDRLWRKKAIRFCNLKRDYKVIDLCCGTGEMIKEICRQEEDISVIGLDYNDAMLKVAYQKLNVQFKENHFKLIKGDVLNIPYDNSSFDVVTIAFGLRNIPNYYKALGEMYRVLKPGGRLICLELSIPTIPIFKNIYQLYFDHVLPLIGYIGTGDRKAYNYLKNSVNHFMKKPELKSAFEKSGFIETGYVSLTGGIASIHYGNKSHLRKKHLL